MGGFDCRIASINRRRFVSSTSIELRVSEAAHVRGGAADPLSGSAVALDALADIEMLAECDYHVLVLRSAVSRLAYALSLGRRQRHTPLISLQDPWPSSARKKK